MQETPKTAQGGVYVPHAFPLVGDTNSEPPSRTLSGVINPPLFKLMLLDALKNGSYTQLKKMVASMDTAANLDELREVKNTILNLSVQVAPLKLIAKLLSDDAATELGVNINHQDTDGNTALHLAALNNRLDVAQLFLRDPRINDTILNNNMKQPIDCTKDLHMIALLQYERGQYLEKIALEFRTAFMDHDLAVLDDILSQPRNFELLDINGNDPETGDTVLHEFVKKNDIGMVQWILSHGGDPFKRDKKGRLAIDLVLKTNEQMKQVLRDATKEQSVINMSKVSGLIAPTFKGYLSKWTNFAGGYKLRWFILDSNGVLSYYKSQDDTNNACRGSLNMRSAILHLDSSEKMKFEIIGKSGVSWHLKGNHPTETNRWVWALQGSIRYAKDKEVERMHHSDISELHNVKEFSGFKKNGLSSPILPATIESSDLVMNQVLPDKPTGISRKSSTTSEIVIYSDDEDDDSDTFNEDDNDENIHTNAGPYAQNISMAKSGFKTQLDALRDLMQNMQQNGTSQEAVVISLTAVNSMVESFDELVGLVDKRDDKLLKVLRKQKDMNGLWINSMRDLENELIAKNNELETFESERKKIKKVLTKKFGYSTTSLEKDGHITDAIENNMPSLERSNTAADEEISRILGSDDSDDEFFDADDFSEDEEEDQVNFVDGDILRELNKPETKEDDTTEDITVTEEEEQPIDEAFPESQRKKLEMMEQEKSFIGYEDPPRTELELKVDARPEVSLWGILKSMIGKDLTKVALPVAFNEPTSMLQRLAEDFEYSSLLEQAASFEDSSLRMLYVAVFNMSQYSSTIDRVAKPFNPLLGETFEYSRPDLGFRFFTEQVSHHPPVSAVLAEHPKWDYYGETTVKSAFNGRSFDVQPTATWYLTLRTDDGKEEVYSWKKLTTSVVGILVGSPSIDNYGDMIITNHRTGDQCIVTFKPRGWRSNQWYEMTGMVTDINGEKKWALGGHWNSKVYGKKVVSDDAHIDVANRKNVAAGPSDDGSKFLIWTTRPRPRDPFNLTSYAISLNAPQPGLLPWLPACDTRLRPDQRAMEDGLYDDAEELKHNVEDKQRAVRKQREETGEEYYPMFFVKELHPISGEEFWRYMGNYWKCRADKTLPEVDIF